LNLLRLYILASHLRNPDLPGASGHWFHTISILSDSSMIPVVVEWHSEQRGAQATGSAHGMEVDGRGQQTEGLKGPFLHSVPCHTALYLFRSLDLTLN